MTAKSHEREVPKEWQVDNIVWLYSNDFYPCETTYLYRKGALSPDFIEFSR